MNYDEIKAQYLEPETAARSNSKLTRQQMRNQTPMDSMIRLLPFGCAFFAALIGGTWYFQNPQAAQKQIGQWTGYSVQGVDSDVVADDTSKTKSDRPDNQNGNSFGPFDAENETLGY